jgi:large subunit ribosomal protein L7A
MLTQLENSAKVVGVKQVRRALASGQAKALFLARDADPGLTEPLAQQAQTQGVPVHWTDTMKALGRACHISVGAAVAATI